MIQTVRGMHDIFGRDAIKYKHIVTIAEKIASINNFEPVITPIVEFSQLFERNLGDHSDIVSKEIYRFIDRGNNALALRPEFTAGVVRFFIENGLHMQAMPKKLFSYGPLFRYDRPQKGRYRQFNQVNFEIFGLDGMRSNIDCIRIAKQFLDALKIQGYTIKVNFLGDAESRAKYAKVLSKYFQDNIDSLCEENRSRIENPMRILDSKVNRKIIDAAPTLYDYYGSEYKDEIAVTISSLKEIGIEVVHDVTLVRGLEYYNDFVFEFALPIEGNQNTILGGGRYDTLVKRISEGSADQCAVGFAAGVERLMLLIDEVLLDDEPRFAVASMSSVEFIYSTKVAQALQDKGFIVEIVCYDAPMGKKLQKLNKGSFDYVVICGSDEVDSGTLNVKKMSTGEQKTFKFKEISSKTSVLF